MRRIWSSLQSLSDEEYEKLPPIDFEKAIREGQEARDAVIRETPAVRISSGLRFRGVSERSERRRGDEVPLTRAREARSSSGLRFR